MKNDSVVKLGFLLTAKNLMAGEFEKALASSNKLMQGLGKIGSSWMGPGMALQNLGDKIKAPLEALGKESIDYGDRIAKTARKVGISAQEFAALDYAAPFSGMSSEQLQTGLTQFVKSITAAAGGAKDKLAAFGDLGINIKDNSGNLRPTVEILKDLADVYKGSEDGAGKVAHALETMGRGGASMINLLNTGRSGIEEMSAKAQEMGYIWDDTHFAMAEATLDAKTFKEKAIGGLKLQLGQTFFEQIKMLSEMFTSVIQKVSNFVKEHEGLVSVLLKAALAIGSVLSVLGSLAVGTAVVSWGVLQLGIFCSGVAGVFGKVGKGITWLVKGFKALRFATIAHTIAQAACTIVMKAARVATLLFSAALWTNPITWIVVGIIALIVGVIALIKNWSKVSAFFKRLWASVKETFAKGWEAVKTACTAAWEYIKDLFFKFHPLGILIKNWDSVAEWFVGLKDRFFEWGGNLINGLIEGITAFASNIWEKIKEIGAGIKDAFCNILGINSPSKVFLDYGLNITQGLSTGVDRGAVGALRSVEYMGQNVMPAFVPSPVASLVRESVMPQYVPVSKSMQTLNGGSTTFSYAPVINVGGTAGGSINEVLRSSYAEFVEMIKKYEHDKQRKNFV